MGGAVGIAGKCDTSNVGAFTLSPGSNQIGLFSVSLPVVSYGACKIADKHMALVHELLHLACNNENSGLGKDWKRLPRTAFPSCETVDLSQATLRLIITGQAFRELFSRGIEYIPH